jgi:hypothetical protein
VPDHGLFLVIEAAEPGRLTLPPAARAYTIEFDEIPLQVRLDHGTGDPTLGEAAEGLVDGVFGRSEHHIAGSGVVDVGALHPDGHGIGAVRLRRRHEPALDEGHVGLLELRDHPLPVRVQHRQRTVHLRHTARLPGPELAEDVRALAHQEGALRRSVEGLDLLRTFEHHLEAVGLEMLPGQAQDLRVVTLSAR